MPSLASIVNRVFLKQYLIAFVNTGQPDASGRPTYTVPVTNIPCRWEDREKEIITMEGRKVLSKSYVLLITPIPIGSLVLLCPLGTLTGDISTWTNLPTYPNPPTIKQGAREVLMVNTTPDIKAQSLIYEMWVL